MGTLDLDQQEFRQGAATVERRTVNALYIYLHTRAAYYSSSTYNIQHQKTPKANRVQRRWTCMNSPCLANTHARTHTHARSHTLTLPYRSTLLSVWSNFHTVPSGHELTLLYCHKQCVSYSTHLLPEHKGKCAGPSGKLSTSAVLLQTPQFEVTSRNMHTVSVS